MEIFGGPYEASLQAPQSEWIKYPYRRSTNKESFSRAIFRLLAIPEVASDVSGNLTIHQILRILYADQLSPVETLFRYNSQFDPPALRDAVGRLLCGSYDNRLYQNEIEIRTLTREFDALSAGASGACLLYWEERIRASLLTGSQPNEAIWLQSKKRHKMKSRKSSEKSRHLREPTNSCLKAQEQAYTEVQRLQTELSLVQQKRDAVNLAIANSSRFIRALEQKISALGDASAVAEHLGDVQFSVCPACLTPIAEPEDDSHCHLCKADVTGGRGREKIVAAINEASIQLKQSQQLQVERENRASAYDLQLATAAQDWRTASTHLVRPTPTFDRSSRAAT